ncbi:hypothetical protein H6B28_12220 [Bacteroides mediterraneensis]|nr:hypothetical protein [Bacteroides mediterraneensis]
MKITAKPGTQLETIFKQFYEQAESEKKEVFKMVEEFTGVKPINFGYYWYFGITCVWAEDTWRFALLSGPQNVVPYTVNGHTYFKPNKRLKVSKEFIRKWKEKFRGIDGKNLVEYGIPVYHEESGVYYNWLPIKFGKRYGIEVSSSLLDRMPKNDNKQYEIEL